MIIIYGTMLQEKELKKKNLSVQQNEYPKGNLTICYMVYREAMKHALFRYIFCKKKLHGALKFQRCDSLCSSDD